MGYTCCVPQCKTGYRSNKTGEKIALFQFPKEANLRKKWIAAIPRKNWIPSYLHRIFAKHFIKEDIQSVSVDQREQKKTDEEKILKCVRLKPTAIPSIFPGLPDYFSKNTPAPRSTSASASSRRDVENARIEKQYEDMTKQDKLKDFESFTLNLKKAMLPSGYISVVNDNSAQFH